MDLGWRYVVWKLFSSGLKFLIQRLFEQGRQRYKHLDSAHHSWIGFHCMHSWPGALVWKFCDTFGVIPLQFIPCKCLEFWSSLQGRSGLKLISFSYVQCRKGTKFCSPPEMGAVKSTQIQLCSLWLELRKEWRFHVAGFARQSDIP